MARYRAGGTRLHASQQAALGADDARRRHRHHRDRRHDLAHSRLRRVAARQHPRARTQHHLRREIQRGQPRRGQRLRRTAAAAESHRGGRDGDRKARAVSWNRGHLAGGGRSAHPDAGLLPRGTHEAAGGAGRDGELRQHQLPRDPGRTVLHRDRGVTPAQRRRAGPDAVPGDVRRAAPDPVGKPVRVGAVEYTVVGVVGKRPSAGGFDLGQDDFVVIPETTYRKQFGIQIFGSGRARTRAC